MKKMKMMSKKVATPRQRRCFKKLADHVVSHYPKDADLHRAVLDAMGAMEGAASKKKVARKSTRRRKAVRATRRATRRVARKAPARRRATRKAPRRTTARRSVARRRATRRA